MSVSSILSSLTGKSTHGTVTARSATSTASEEMHTLFSKLHMDAIASASTPTASGTAATGDATPAVPGSSDPVTGLVHSLRHILDGGIAVAKEARTAAKTAASAYAHGGGIGALATQVVDKLG